MVWYPYLYCTRFGNPLITVGPVKSRGQSHPLYTCITTVAGFQFTTTPLALLTQLFRSRLPHALFTHTIFHSDTRSCISSLPSQCLKLHKNRIYRIFCRVSFSGLALASFPRFSPVPQIFPVVTEQTLAAPTYSSSWKNMAQTIPASLHARWPISWHILSPSMKIPWLSTHATQSHLRIQRLCKSSMVG